MAGFQDSITQRNTTGVAGVYPRSYGSTSSSNSVATAQALSGITQTTALLLDAQATTDTNNTITDVQTGLDATFKELSNTLKKDSLSLEQGKISQSELFTKQQAVYSKAVTDHPNKVALINKIFQDNGQVNPYQAEFNAQTAAIKAKADAKAKYNDEGIRLATASHQLHTNPDGTLNVDASVKAGYVYEDNLRIASDPSNPRSASAMMENIDAEFSPAGFQSMLNSLASNPELYAKESALKMQAWNAKAFQYRALANQLPTELSSQRTAVLDMIDNTTKMYQSITGLTGTDAASVLKASNDHWSNLSKAGIIAAAPQDKKFVAAIVAQNPQGMAKAIGGEAAKLMGQLVGKTADGASRSVPLFNIMSGKTSVAGGTLLDRQAHATTITGMAANFANTGDTAKPETAKIMRDGFLVADLGSIASSSENLGGLLSKYNTPATAKAFMVGATDKEMAGVSGKVVDILHKSLAATVKDLGDTSGFGEIFDISINEAGHLTVDSKGFENLNPSQTAANIIGAPLNAYNQLKANQLVDTIDKRVRTYIEVYGSSDPRLDGLSAKEAFAIVVNDTIRQATGGRGIPTSSTAPTKFANLLGEFLHKPIEKPNLSGPDTSKDFATTVFEMFGAGTAEEPIQFKVKGVK